MNYIKYLVFSLVLFISFTSNVSAKSCDSDDIARLKVLANNIDYQYEYISDKYSHQLYKVYFNNLTDEIYIRYNGYNYFENSLSLEAASGTAKFYVYATNCFEKKIRTIEVKLPKFNEYSLSDECIDIGADKLDICSEWYPNELTDEQFELEINNYYSKIEKKSFIDILKDNYLIVSGIVIILIFIICAFIFFKRKKNVLE